MFVRSTSVAWSLKFGESSTSNSKSSISETSESELEAGLKSFEAIN